MSGVVFRSAKCKAQSGKQQCKENEFPISKKPVSKQISNSKSQTRVFGNWNLNHWNLLGACWLELGILLFCFAFFALRFTFFYTANVRHPMSSARVLLTTLFFGIERMCCLRAGRNRGHKDVGRARSPVAGYWSLVNLSTPFLFAIAKTFYTGPNFIHNFFLTPCVLTHRCVSCI